MPLSYSQIAIYKSNILLYHLKVLDLDVLVYFKKTQLKQVFRILSRAIKTCCHMTLFITCQQMKVVRPRSGTAALVQTRE